MEEQRLQSEADDKWLEEAEDDIEGLEEPGPSAAPATNGYAARAPLAAGISQLSLNSHSGKSTVALEKLKKATAALTTAVDQLHNSFSKEMRHEGFVVAVRNVTAKLQQLFSEATELLNETDEERRRQVELTEALIGNDMKQMADAMQKIANFSHEPVS